MNRRVFANPIIRADNFGVFGRDARQNLRIFVVAEIGVALNRFGFGGMAQNELLNQARCHAQTFDFDGTGRAVPALDTLLLHINGLKTSPLAMSDNKGNRVSIELEDARDALMGEAIGRNLCVAFSQMGGLSGWMVRKNDIKNNLPLKSVTKSCQIGEVLRSATSSAGIFDRLAETGLVCKEIGRGKVIAAGNAQVAGFDKGFVEIQGEDGRIWKTHFLNENLILEEISETGSRKTLMTVPDITCYINADTCAPLSNADIVGKNGEILVENVVLGVIKVDEAWWKSDIAYLQKIWSHYFDILGMPNQKIVRIEEV